MTDYNGTLPQSTSNGSGQRLARENTVGDAASQSAESSSKGSVSTGAMKKASSTTALNTTGKTDSATSQSVRQPCPSTKPSSGVPRFIQRDLASRRTVAAGRSGTPPQRMTLSKHTSDHATKSSVSGVRIVSPLVQARAEGLPSDPISLTRYTVRGSRQLTSSSQPSAPPSSVLEVSASASQPPTFYTLTLVKSDIDKANKDTQNKVYSSDFKVTCCILSVL